jgi:hypothetical protein
MSVISAGNTTTTSLTQTADTSGNLVFTTGGANTVALTLTNTQGATFAGTVTATGGVVVGASAAPAFSAYANATQTLTASTFTKLQANVEEFDTNSNYDNVTNYRFTPTVAGYYQFSGGCSFSTTQTAEVLITLYRNGARYKTLFDMEATSWGGYGTALVYANGSTDYFELYLYSASTGTKTTAANSRDNYFQACFVRSA